MSKHEDWMVDWYWQGTGGTLITEFQAVARAPDRGERRLDAIILPDGPLLRTRASAEEIRGRDVVVVQAKFKRLGMYLMGQTLFSRDLVRSLGVRSVRSVALCTQDDVVLRPLLEKHEGCEVVVVDPSLRPPRDPDAARDLSGHLGM